MLGKSCCICGEEAEHKYDGQFFCKDCLNVHTEVFMNEMEIW